MCQNCTHARAQIAGKLMLYHIDMLSVMGYAVMEGALDEYIDIKHPGVDEEERNRIVTDVAASQGAAWTLALSENLGDLLGKYVARGARECERSVKVPGNEDLADNKDLDKLMDARQTMEQILTDSNVRLIIDDLTNDGEDEES